ETQAAPAVEAGHRRALRPLDLDAELAAGLELALEHVDPARLRGDEIAVEPAEVAIDRLVAADCLDAVDRRDLALVQPPRLVRPAHADQLVVVIVEFGGEVSRGPRGHPAADRAAVDDDDRASLPGELVGDREAGNSR